MLRTCRVILGTAVMLPWCLSLAQQPAPAAVSPKNAEPVRKLAKAPAGKQAPKLSEDQKLGLQLLETSEAASRGFEAPMRSYSLLQIASSLSEVNKSKARGLLRDSFTASLGIQDDDQTKTRIQQEIFRALLLLSQPDVEDLLPQAEMSVRKPVTDLLVSRDAEKKQFDKALELINQIAALDEFPYGSANTLIQAMPAEMQAEKQNLFLQAINSYKNHEHPGVRIGGPTMTNLVVRTAAIMPPKLVLVAIDEILSQAKAQATNHDGIRLSGKGGSASFASDYQYQLFALLPTLRKLDADRAKQLVDENRELQATLQEFPDGMNSLMPPPKPGIKQHVQSITEVQDKKGPDGSGNGPAPPLPAMEAQYLISQDAHRRADTIVGEGTTDPTQAIAQTMTLPLVLDDDLAAGGSSPRAEALKRIARINAGTDPSGASQALAELMTVAGDLPPRLQVQYLASAADLYVGMNDQENAAKAVNEGMKAAGKLLEIDTNADDPNTALKAWWPSTDAYRRFMEVEIKISPRAAQNVLQAIDDPEIRAMESIMVARSLLGLPVQRFIVAEKRKNSNTVSVFDSSN